MTRAQVEEAFRRPWSLVLSVLVFAVAVAIGSIYSAELKQNFPFALAIPFPRPFWGFWGLICLLALLTYARLQDAGTAKSATWLSEEDKTGLEQILRKPWFGAVTTIVGAVSALIGSLYATELKSNFPLKLAVPDPEIVIVFWITLFVFGLLFFGTLWAQLRASTRSETNLLLGVLDLQAMPPAGFLWEFNKLLLACSQAAAATLNQRKKKRTAEEIAETIRVVLSAIINLAEQFHRERSGQPCRYAANVMTFREIDSMSPEERARLVGDGLKFWEPFFDLSTYAGVLQLDPALSTASNSLQAPDPDFKSSPFALAIPKVSSNVALETLKDAAILPGAPWTFVTGKPIVFKDAHELLADAQRGNFTPGQIRMIEAYTKSPIGQKIRSFISVPIPPVDFNDAHRPIGVLNIHRDIDGIFPGAQVQLFPPLTLPFRAILSLLLVRYLSSRPTPVATAPSASSVPPVASNIPTEVVTPALGSKPSTAA